MTPRCHARISLIVLLNVCIPFAGSALADPQLTGKTYTHSYPPLDVEGATADRAKRPRGRFDRPLVVRGPPDRYSSMIFFSTGNDCQHTDIFPVIAVFREGEWNTIAFDDRDFKNHQWSHLYLSYPDKQRMYAISRAYCGDMGGKIYVYRSFDGGETWAVSTVKIDYMAHFLSLRIEPDGTGEIIVQSDNDADPVGGHHVYNTNDWGASWSQSEFSGTILAPPVLPHPCCSEYVPVTTLMRGVSDAYARHRAGQ